MARAARYAPLRHCRHAAEAAEALASAGPFDAVVASVTTATDLATVLGAAQATFPAVKTLVLVEAAEPSLVNLAFDYRASVLVGTSADLEIAERSAAFIKRETHHLHVTRSATERYILEHGLTGKPAGILHAFMRGVPRGELAWAFGIAESTVRSHVTAILDGRFASLEFLRDHILSNAVDPTERSP